MPADKARANREAAERHLNEAGGSMDYATLHSDRPERLAEVDAEWEKRDRLERARLKRAEERKGFR